LPHGSTRWAFDPVARAHAVSANRVHAWLRMLEPDCRCYVCPTEYQGKPPFSDYLAELGRELNPAIALMYTGPDVCAHAITVADVDAVAEVMQRKPLIWDNYPVNDLTMRRELHIGPLLHRDPNLGAATAGLLANLMNEAEASKIPLLPVADYVADPASYDPWASWERAPREVAGPESYKSLRRFAENSLASCLDRAEAPTIDGLVAGALEALKRGESPSSSEPVQALSGYLDELDESCYHLKNRMQNLALRRDLLPWIEALEHKVWMGRGALRILRALESEDNPQSGVKLAEDCLASTRQSEKHIGGKGIVKLAKYALRQAKDMPKPSMVESTA